MSWLLRERDYRFSIEDVPLGELIERCGLKQINPIILKQEPRDDERQVGGVATLCRVRGTSDTATLVREAVVQRLRLATVREVLSLRIHHPDTREKLVAALGSRYTDERGRETNPFVKEGNLFLSLMPRWYAGDYVLAYPTA